LKWGPRVENKPPGFYLILKKSYPYSEKGFLQIQFLDSSTNKNTFIVDQNILIFKNIISVPKFKHVGKKKSRRVD